MHILIPRNPAPPPRRRPSSPRLGVYITLRDVVGRPATMPDLTHALAKLRRSDVIRWLAAISGWIDGEAGLEMRNQLAMADQLLTEDLRKGLREHLRRAPDGLKCIFQRRQLWFVLQTAVLACKEDTAERPEEELRHAVGECCLMASDILHEIDPMKPPDSGAEEVNQWTASVIIPILESKAQAEILARAQSFWFDLQSTTAIQKRAREMGVKDFNGAFTDKYGIPLREFFLILLSIYSGFEGHSLHSQSPLLLDEAVYLHPCFAKEDVRRVLAAVSQTPDELAFKLMSEARQNWAIDFTPLRGTPVIHVFPGKYACPDRSLLYRWITDGMYFLLQRAYPEGKFGQLFGYVFEEYVHRLVREFSCESAILVRTFYASPKFRGTADQACDGLIHREDTAVLMEYKARRLTTREKYGGSAEVTLKGINDILYCDKKGGSKGVVQLAKSLARMLRGERVAAGAGEDLDLSTCRHIFPAIITYEEAVAVEAVRQEADVKLRTALTAEGADPDRVGPLLVLGIDDIEILEDLAHNHDPRDVIHDYVNYLRHNLKNRTSSFHSYVCNGGYAKASPAGQSLVDRIFQRVMSQAGAEVECRQPKAKPESEGG